MCRFFFVISNLNFFLNCRLKIKLQSVTTATPSTKLCIEITVKDNVTPKKKKQNKLNTFFFNQQKWSHAAEYRIIYYVQVMINIKHYT